MPEVICNTSALQYLHQLGLLDLLRQLYGSVIVPQAVAREIAVGKAHGVDLPDLPAIGWLKVIPVVPPAVAPSELGPGEVAVLSLASGRADTVVVLDDALARRYARLAAVRFTGTCGILLRAKQRGLIPAIAPLLDQLTELGFRLDTGTRSALLRMADEGG